MKNLAIILLAVLLPLMAFSQGQEDIMKIMKDGALPKNLFDAARHEKKHNEPRQQQLKLLIEPNELLGTLQGINVKQRDGDVTVLDSFYLLLFDTASSAWIPQARYYNTYDVDGRLSQQLYHLYDTLANTWNKDRLFLFQYDLDGKETVKTEQRWSTYFPEWRNYRRTVTTYNQGGLPLEKVTGSWNFQTSNWDNLERLQFNYSEQDLLSELKKQKWNVTDWKNQERTLYTYTPIGDTMDIVLQTWDSWTTNDWKNSTRTAMTYSLDGQLSEKLLEYWTYTNEWRKDSRQLFSYNENGFTQEIIYQWWSSYSGVWRDENRLLFSYDGTGNITSVTQQIWNYWDEVWENQYINKLTYDGEGNMTHLYVQPWQAIEFGFVNTYRIIVDYDVNGDTTALILEQWDTSQNTWGNYIQYLMEYDTTGQLSTRFGQYWIDSTQEWQSILIWHYSYYPSVLMQEEKILGWDFESQSWVNFERTLREYDSENRLTVITSENGDNNTGDWVPVKRTLFAYGLNGLKNEETYQLFDTLVGWHNDYRYFYSYNAADLLEELVYSGWSLSLNDWSIYSRITYSYNIQGWLVEELYQHLGIEWQNSSRNLFTYDTNGNLTEEIGQDWFTSGSIWVNDYRLTNQYNASGLVVEYTEFDWPSNGTEWVPTLKSESTYDSENLLIKEEGFQWNQNMWVPIATIYRNYTSNGLLTELIRQDYGPTGWAWVDMLDYAYYWSNLEVDLITESMESGGLECVFENPYLSSSPVQCEGMELGRDYELYLYDTNGKLVHHRPFDNGMALKAMDDLPMGMFILAIKSEGKTVYLRKVVSGR